MRYFFGIYVLVFTLVCSTASAGTVFVKIPSIHCFSCVRSIKSAFESILIEGGIKANFKTKIVTLHLSQDLSSKEIRKKLDSVGYKATRITKEKN